jgi:hypothetical protein
MGRKSSSKGQTPSVPPPPVRKGFNPVMAGVIIVAIVAAVGIAFWGGGGPAGSGGQTPDDHQGAAAHAAGVTPEIEAKVRAAAALGPRKQTNLPPVPFQAYAPPRPHDVITAAYQFAAEHPEILSYVPCYCGCQHSGHTGNASCFVKARTPEGDVLEWDEHGVECAVCIDVANRSRQMHAAGASVRDIRAAIDKEFGEKAQTQTPTPRPPDRSQASD